MRGLLGLVLGVWVAAASGLEAAPRILKVLQHRLDEQGRHTLSPSLFERDAYQAELRMNPERVTGLRFEVSWKGLSDRQEPLQLRLEARTMKGDPDHPLVLEREVRADRWGATWSTLTLDGETFRKVGEVTAWRATLWHGDVLLTEQKSFLW